MRIKNVALTARRQRFFLCLALGMLLLAAPIACSTSSKKPPALAADAQPWFPGLKSVASFPIGVGLEEPYIHAKKHVALIEHVFNRLTPGNAMKQDVVLLPPDEKGDQAYAFDLADSLVNFAQDRGMQVHGHTLIWHGSVPAWLRDFPGSDKDFANIVRQYIEKSVSRYRGSVSAWDVVSEAFADETGDLRDTIFRQRLGEDYVAQCFRWAHRANPDALLFYNDYNVSSDRKKRKAILAMLDRFQQQGVPIHGIGLQTHVQHDWPEVDLIRQTMEQFVERGLKIHLSELDVRVNYREDQKKFTAKLKQLQKMRVKDVVRAYVLLPAINQYGITVWGLTDADHWLVKYQGKLDWPLLFAGDFAPKPAYFGFLAALTEKTPAKQ